MTKPPAEALDLSEAVVIVTGAGGTIGGGIARRFSAAGAAVVAHSRRSNLDHLAGELSGPVATVQADLTSEGGPEAVVGAALSSFGRIDALINNAGIQPVIGLNEMDDDDWRIMIDTNLTALHRLTQRTAREMMRTGGGSVVHIGSIEGCQPAPLHGHYSTVKAGVIMHARAAALEYGPHRIRVNAVSPGLVGGDDLRRQWPEGVERWMAAVPLGRVGTPEDIGDACVFLCSELARWITGINLVVDGGILARPTW